MPANICNVSVLLMLCQVAIAVERDPTLPENTELVVKDNTQQVNIETGEQFILQAIFTNNDRAIALVNNNLVHEGDTLNKAIVETIKEHSVVIKNNKKKIELSIPSKPITRRAY